MATCYSSLQPESCAEQSEKKAVMMTYKLTMIIGLLSLILFSIAILCISYFVGMRFDIFKSITTGDRCLRINDLTIFWTITAVDIFIMNMLLIAWVIYGMVQYLKIQRVQ